MDESSRTSQLSLIRTFCAGHAPAVLLDEPSRTLMDTFSAKVLPIRLDNLVLVQERLNKETGRPYLLLIYGDSRQLALADVGIAFAPDFRNTGPLSDLPDAICFRDFRTLLDRFKHEFYGHGEQAPAQDAVRLLMMCIAILDGARAQGFDVGREEKELNWHLSELEKHGGPSPDG